jgi:hypothetical protein
MRERRHRSICGGVLLAVTSLGASAHAAEKDVCIAAANEGQDQRLAHHLISAREQFLTCVRPECPALIRKSCAEWFADVDARIPTAVFGVRDSNGKDLTAVRVYVDGALVRESLDGTSTPLDPGPHKLRFDHAHDAPVEIDLIVREGEKNRIVNAVLGREQAAASREPPAPRHARPSPVPALGVGAAGLVVLGGALFLGFNGHADVRALRAECGGRCDVADVDAARTKLVIADVALVVATLALAASGYMLLTGRKAE